MNKNLSGQENTARREPNDKGGQVLLTTNPGMDQIDREQWNAMVPPDDPSLRHEFLLALEHSGSCCAETGWVPCHITASIDGQLVGGVPCYLKNHSYGEFVFDWAWANAYERAGLAYYPKLLIAAPFTPVTGARLLVHPEFAGRDIADMIARSLPTIASKLKASSVHCIFCNPSDLQTLSAQGFIAREGRQFHWYNKQYQRFEDFLGALSSKKRKNILRERRRVRDEGVSLSWIAGRDIQKHHTELLYACYRNTIAEHGSYAYLNPRFFVELAESLPEGIQLLVASQGGNEIACGFFLRGQRTLYGRYWGALTHVNDLHFEVCYYSPIEYCIEHGLHRFEAGAQGEHKLSRGLTPQKTQSAHWLANPGFHEAVRRFTSDEEEHLADYTRILESHSPFKRNKPDNSRC